MLTLEQYQAYVDAVDKFDKYIQEHPEVIEEAMRKYAEQFVDVKDVALGDKVPFRNLNPAEIPVELHTFFIRVLEIVINVSRSRMPRQSSRLQGL